MPYGNHIAYTSKAVKVSLFDLSQQLLPTVTFSYRERRSGERAQSKFGLGFLKLPLSLSLRLFLSLYTYRYISIQELKGGNFCHFVRI